MYAKNYWKSLVLNNNVIAKIKGQFFGTQCRNQTDQGMKLTWQYGYIRQKEYKSATSNDTNLSQFSATVNHLIHNVYQQYFAKTLNLQISRQVSITI